MVLGKGLVNPIATFADVSFQVEKQQMLGHSVVINIRAPNLITPKGQKKKPLKKKGGSAQIIVPPNISHKTLTEVLYFAYTGSVEFSKLSVPQILAVNAAAIELEIPRLQWLCENYLQTHLAMDNLFSVLKGADSYKMQHVKDFCFHYILDNYNQFLGNKDGVKDLGIDLFQEAVEVYQASQAGQVKPLQNPAEPPNTVVQDYKTVFDEMEGSDVTFKVGNEFIPCHKAIVASYSNELTQLCSQPNISRKDAPDHIVLPEIKGKEGFTISGSAFKSFLRFCYYADKKIPALEATQLVPFTKDMNVPDLQYICEDIISASINKDTVIGILEVTYMQQMEDRTDVALELRKKCIDFILNHMNQIDLKPLRKLNPNIAIDVLIARQQFEKGGLKAVLAPKPPKDPKKDPSPASSVSSVPPPPEESPPETSSEEMLPPPPPPSCDPPVDQSDAKSVGSTKSSKKDKKEKKEKKVRKAESKESVTSVKSDKKEAK